jgi:hypothetical protein
VRLKARATSVDRDKVEVIPCYYIVFKLVVDLATLRSIVFFVAVPGIVVIRSLNSLGVSVLPSTPDQAFRNPLLVEEAY